MNRWAFVHCLAPLSSPPSELAETLLRLSSLVCLARQGAWLEAHRSITLWGSEARLIEQARDLAHELGYRASVVLADHHEVARLLSQSQESPQCLVIPPGKDAEVLAPLPLEALEPSPAAFRSLRRLGIRTIGQLSRLSPLSLARRLGPEGTRLGLLARAEPLPRPPRYVSPTQPVVQQELEPPVPGSEAVLFFVKALLDELTAGLAQQGQAFSALEVTLFFEGGQTRTEQVQLVRPVRSPAPFLAILQERLLSLSTNEEMVPAPRLTGIEARALRVSAAPLSQLTLAGPQEIHHEKLATLLGRLAVGLGADRLWGAEELPSHRPETAWRPTVPLEGAGRESSLPPEDHALAARPVFCLSPPLLVTGELRAGTVLHWEGGSGRVRYAWGPERLRGQWWDDPFDRDYYVVDLDDGNRLWIYHDRSSRQLYLQGIFD